MILDKDNGLSSFFSKVFLWMFIGLLVSGATAYYTSVNASILRFVANNFSFILLAELIVVIVFSFLRSKVSPLVAKILFLSYSLISGFTLSSIFLVFKIGSIGMVFLASAIMFGLLAFYGYTTKNDLSKMGRILFFGLIAIIIMSVINIIAGNGTFGILISVISIVVFLGLTAWDMQSLKAMYNYYSNNENELDKIAIYGALDLYLDFVNIFLKLLGLFGKERD